LGRFAGKPPNRFFFCFSDNPDADATATRDQTTLFGVSRATTLFFQQMGRTNGFGETGNNPGMPAGEKL
jgi:hypothetical protein